MAELSTTHRDTVKLVIDTDGVFDDVRAISLALQSAHVQVIAISCVKGCISVQQAVANVARTLRANDAVHIPIYKGAENPLIGNNHGGEPHFFGVDGLGDVPDVPPKVEPTDKYAHVSDKHSAQGLVETFIEHPDATLVCIGPLTNIALAIKLNPDFAKIPKRMVIMGGNIHASGNVRSNSTAEFNFSMDPEAAHIVLKELQCDITIVPWEAFLNESVKTNVDLHAHLHMNAPLARFLEAVSRKGRHILSKSDKQYAFCDEIAMGVAIAPERIITKTVVARASVELHGEYTRGQCAVDWTDILWKNNDSVNHRVDRTNRTINFVENYNVVELDHMIRVAIQNSIYTSKDKQ